MIRLQGVTSAHEKLADSDSGGFLTRGTVTRAPMAGPGEYPPMLPMGPVGQQRDGDLQVQVTTLH